MRRRSGDSGTRPDLITLAFEESGDVLLQVAREYEASVAAETPPVLVGAMR